MYTYENFGLQNKIRLLNILTDLQKSGVVFISGDVHYGLMTQSPCSALTGYIIPEITTSGMTHTAADLVALTESLT